MKTFSLHKWSKGTSSGFTLIELLIVMAVIAILAALTMGTFTYAQQASSRNRTTATLTALKNGLEGYKTEFGEYPEPVVKNYTTSFVERSGAHMLYQALTGDGADAMTGSGAGDVSNGEFSADERKRAILRDGLPPAMIYPPRVTLGPGTAGARYIVDGFGRPFLYAKGPAADVINPTYDLWSYGNYDVKVGTPSATLTTKKDFASTGTWIKNW